MEESEASQPYITPLKDGGKKDELFIRHRLTM